MQKHVGEEEQVDFFSGGSWVQIVAVEGTFKIFNDDWEWDSHCDKIYKQKHFQGGLRDKIYKKTFFFQGGSNSCCDSLHNRDSLACVYGRCRSKRGGKIYH